MYVLGQLECSSSSDPTSTTGDHSDASSVDDGVHVVWNVGLASRGCGRVGRTKWRAIATATARDENGAVEHHFGRGIGGKYRI